MLHIDIPSRSDIVRLADTRADPCVTIYLATTPLTEKAQADRIALKNLLAEAVRQAEAAGIAKRALWPIEEAAGDLVEDDDFWAHQANSLALFLTPDSAASYRLPNRIDGGVHVSDRFHLSPLLRAATFPHNAYVLAIGKGGARLVEVSADLPPHVVPVPGLPADMADALGRRSHTERTGPGTSGESASEGALLRRYARSVDGALRPVLSGHERPLIVAAAEPLASVFRSVSSYGPTLRETIPGAADRTPEHDLAAAAREVLDRHYAAETKSLRGLYREREAEGRATSDLAQAARAATAGAVDTLIVDMEAVVPGSVDAAGGVTFADADDATAYSIADEIAARALRSGARVVAVRSDDMPGGGALAAILRYAV